MEIENSENLSENEAYNAPDGYFEQLESNLFAKINKEGYILESNIPHPFTVPRNYFETLDQRVFERVKKEEPSIAVSYRKPNIRKYISIAASVLIVASVSLFYYFNNQNQSDTIALKEISTEEIYDYLAMQNINHEDLYNAVETIEISSETTSASAGLNDLTEEELQELIDSEI